MDSVDTTIPARIVIGVTGHRTLDADSEVSDAIHSVVERIQQMLPSMQNTTIILSVLSPLAEGADRLVARDVLKTPGSTLEIVLPLPKDDYVQDFETGESISEFEELLSKATNVKELQTGYRRPKVYEQVGHYIVDQCDVLIAIWDGKSAEGPGGTGDIVAYARETKCPMFWINTEDSGKITFEPGRGLSVNQFKDLSEYNSEKVNTIELNKQIREQLASLVNQAHNASLSIEHIKPSLEYMLGHLVRADILAQRYQHLYYRSGTLVYILAAAAIAIAALQIIFIPEQPLILIAEVVFMIAVLVIVWLSRHQRWHSKWLDYRFLAERFRSAMFLAVSKIDVTSLRPPRHLSLAYSSNDWMVNVFSSVWNKRPLLQEIDTLVTSLRDFLCNAWIGEQIRYHDKTSKRHDRRHERLLRASNVLFGLTLVAAILHVISIGPHSFENFLGLMVIALPATAGGITAIRTHRDYLRNSMRSAEMVGHLKELQNQMMKTENREALLRLVAETEETMLHENEDWRVVVRFHIPELPV